MPNDAMPTTLDQAWTEYRELTLSIGSVNAELQQIQQRGQQLQQVGTAKVVRGREIRAWMLGKGVELSEIDAFELAAQNGEPQPNRKARRAPVKKATKRTTPRKR